MSVVFFVLHVLLMMISGFCGVMGLVILEKSKRAGYSILFFFGITVISAFGAAISYAQATKIEKEISKKNDIIENITDGPDKDKLIKERDELINEKNMHITSRDNWMKAFYVSLVISMVLTGVMFYKFEKPKKNPPKQEDVSKSV
jgi:hypothetical protein